MPPYEMWKVCLPNRSKEVDARKKIIFVDTRWKYLFQNVQLVQGSEIVKYLHCSGRHCMVYRDLYHVELQFRASEVDGFLWVDFDVGNVPRFSVQLNLEDKTIVRASELREHCVGKLGPLFTAASKVVYIQMVPNATGGMNLQPMSPNAAVWSQRVARMREANRLHMYEMH